MFSANNTFYLIFPFLIIPLQHWASSTVLSRSDKSRDPWHHFLSWRKHFTIQFDICCRFLTDSLYQIKDIPGFQGDMCVFFLLFILNHEWVLNFTKWCDPTDSIDVISSLNV